MIVHISSIANLLTLILIVDRLIAWRCLSISRIAGLLYIARLLYVAWLLVLTHLLAIRWLLLHEGGFWISLPANNWLKFFAV